MAVSIKGLKKEAFAFCRLALTLCGKFIYPATKLSVTGISEYFFRMPMRASSSLGNLGDSSTRLGLLGHPVSWTEKRQILVLFFRR